MTPRRHRRLAPPASSENETRRGCLTIGFNGADKPYLIVKYLTTAALIVLVSEVAKRSDKLGALLAALPLVTLLTLIWLHIEQQPAARITNHAWYTFWYVVPTLPMFLAFPALHSRLGFWPTLGASALITMASFAVFALVVRRYGIELL